MKRLILPFAIVLSGLLFSCATTDAVVESKPDAAQIEETKTVDKENDDVKSEEANNNTHIIEETSPAEELNVDTDVVETSETNPEIDENLSEPEITEPEEEIIEIFETVGLTKKVGSLEAAEKIANFKMEIPKTFAVYKPSEYFVQDEYKISVTYRNTKKSDEIFVIRKAVGNLDVSEDFTKYSFTKILVENGTRVIAKGVKEDFYNLATWTDNYFTYSMESNVGFPKEVIYAFIGELN